MQYTNFLMQRTIFEKYHEVSYDLQVRSHSANTYHNKMYLKTSKPSPITNF